MSEEGVEFKGGSLHNGFGSFDGFGGSGNHLALLSLVLQDRQEGKRLAVSVVTATPP